MTRYRTTIGGEGYSFGSLRETMAAATPLRSGDELAGIAAESETARVAAQAVLADLPLTTFLNEALVPYESDAVTRLILDAHDEVAFAPIRSMTVGGFRDWLLSDAATPEKVTALAPGLTPEMVAATSKLMRNRDLISAALKAPVTSAFRTTLGLPGRLGSRLQPNHPSDDLKGIAASLLDGLAFGVGDAVIGINPATDNIPNAIALIEMLDELRLRYEIPTQSCVLTHITNSIEIMARAAPVDLVFQSIAGTEAANDGFGVTLPILDEAHEAALALGRGTVGENVMYFETGQGSALVSDTHHGVDQQTLEVRAYGVARRYKPLLVNTVVGFIGPEVLYDGKQIIRAGLEDHFCGKLLGLPMGVDVCYTNHIEADQNDMDVLMTLLSSAGVSFLIAVPGADDVMLSYQSLSYHDIAYLRNSFGLKAAPEFEAWLESAGLVDGHGHLIEAEDAPRALLAGAL